MSRMKITTTIEVDGYPSTNVPHTLVFHYEKGGGGDNPRFFSDAVQRAVWKAAAEIHEYMEQTVDLKQDRSPRKAVHEGDS